MMNKTSIIYVNWNTADLLLDSIASVVKGTKRIDFELIVVDNGSYDGCRERLSKGYPDAVFVQSEENLGFAKANNLGAKYANGEFLLFLNPDTMIIDDAIDLLALRLPKLDGAGIVSGCLLNEDGSKQLSCVRAFPTIFSEMFDSDFIIHNLPHLKMWGLSPLSRKSDVEMSVEVLSGACMLIRKDVFNQIGGFSDNYFMYSEDVDLCLKAVSAGFKNYYISKPKIVHYGGGSTKIRKKNFFSDIMITESRMRYFRKYRGEVYSVTFRFMIFCMSVVRLLLLFAALPIKRLGSKDSYFDISVGKWWKKLRWSIGLEKWATRYPVSILDS
jgi:N-acetylglucosaminyl-diphospho-decaprenol L-rhamnosyltransferase